MKKKKTTVKGFKNRISSTPVDTTNTATMDGWQPTQFHWTEEKLREMMDCDFCCDFIQDDGRNVPQDLIDHLIKDEMPHGHHLNIYFDALLTFQNGRIWAETMDMDLDDYVDYLVSLQILSEE